MYTLREVASDNFKLRDEFDIVNIDGVDSVYVKLIEGQEKTIKVNLTIYDYFFNGTFRNLIRKKIVKDLGENYKFTYGISFHAY